MECEARHKNALKKSAGYINIFALPCHLIMKEIGKLRVVMLALRLVNRCGTRSVCAWIRGPENIASVVGQRKQEN
jgi:hypothetical protein